MGKVESYTNQSFQAQTGVLSLRIYVLNSYIRFFLKKKEETKFFLSFFYFYFRFFLKLVVGGLVGDSFANS